MGHLALSPPYLCLFVFCLAFFGGSGEVAQRATSLGPRPSLFLVSLFCFVLFCFSFLFVEGKSWLSPSKRASFGYFQRLLCFSLASCLTSLFYSLFLYLFLFLSVSLSLLFFSFFLPSFPSFLLYFASLFCLFVSWPLAFVLCFCFMKRTTSKCQIRKFV